MYCILQLNRYVFFLLYFLLVFLLLFLWKITFVDFVFTLLSNWTGSKVFFQERKEGESEGGVPLQKSSDMGGEGGGSKNDPGDKLIIEQVMDRWRGQRPWVWHKRDGGKKKSFCRCSFLGGKYGGWKEEEGGLTIGQEKKRSLVVLPRRFFPLLCAV